MIVTDSIAAGFGETNEQEVNKNSLSLHSSINISLPVTDHCKEGKKNFNKWVGIQCS